MIELIEGRGVGSGKSYMVMSRLLPHWMKGGTACVSDTVEVKWQGCVEYAARVGGVVLQADQYRSISSDEMQRLHEVTPPGTGALPVLIVVDEAQDAFNARDWSDKAKRPFFSWLCQSRHDDNDVIIISQAVANVDKQVRRLATYIWITRNTEHFPFAGTTLALFLKGLTLGLWDGKMFRVTQLDQDGRTALGKSWARADKGLFQCYETKAMRGKHPRLGEAVAVKKLEQVKQKGFGMKLAAILIVGLIAFGAWKTFGHGNPLKRSANVAGSNTAEPAATRKAEDYRIERVTYVGSFPGILATVEYGNLVAGEMSGLGMVEVTDSKRARVRAPGGVLVYVVADLPPVRPMMAVAAIP